MADGWEPKPNSNVYELVTGTASNVSVADMKTALSNAVAQMQERETKYVFFNCIFGPFYSLQGLYGRLCRWNDNFWFCDIVTLDGAHGILSYLNGTYEVKTYSYTSTSV